MNLTPSVPRKGGLNPRPTTPKPPAPAGQRTLPKWAQDRGRGLAARLLEILRIGGQRKRTILKAWAEWAGYERFDQSVTLMLERGDLIEFTKPGPANDDSGPYLALGARHEAT